VNFTREELISRHRLSGQQADVFLGQKIQSADRGSRLMKLRQLGYLLQLMEEMKSRKLETMVLKGPVLSQKIYGDPFYRTSHDFDLLFHPEDLSSAVQFFKNKGFKGVKFQWPSSSKKQKAVMELMNQYFIYNPENQISIELHWKIFDRRFTDLATAEHLAWENSTAVDINGKKIKTLDGEFELLYLVIHGSLHAWFRLKWLVDVHQILSQNSIDADRFKRLTHRLGAENFVAVCNGVLSHVYPKTKLLPCDKKPSQRLIEEAVYQLERRDNDPFNSFYNTFRQVRYQLALSGSWQYKIDIFRTLLFNKRDLDISWLPSGKVTLFIFRPITFLMRKFGWIA
jgi:hypothetical protein